ncbi:hypothetical protein MBEHAL_2585 [Halarchaeum acidiphilum MH1-52-1]|uniref:Uncharacterized protein n=1 Tax=Halarchaeum acidiphilum MH1-52-1 TaxID=1261545 RepID=U2YXQ9_9EURY|nr:hypothetical protein MBEHAL_2585 [Halarchaeum acidiphilum MH1-52-1]
MRWLADASILFVTMYFTLGSSLDSFSVTAQFYLAKTAYLTVLCQI